MDRFARLTLPALSLALLLPAALAAQVASDTLHHPGAGAAARSDALRGAVGAGVSTPGDSLHPAGVTGARAQGATLQAARGSETQGRIEIDTLHSKALEGNRLGDRADREIVVYLPPSYDASPDRRYPVLYLLHGVTSVPQEWLDGSYQGFNLALAMDSVAAAGGSEYIVVMPNADNAAGGSFYVNSAAFGKWEEFVAHDLVAFVDARYRTIAERRGRGIAGQSMGGFGALYLAPRHADLYGSVYAMSPCCLGFVGDMAPENSAWGKASRVARIVGLMAAAFAPATRLTVIPPRDTAGGAGPRIVGPLPYTVDSLGSRKEQFDVLTTWREFLPLERLAREAAPWRGFSAIMLDAGNRDQFTNVTAGARAFSTALTRAGIRNRYEEYDGGHVDRARERFEQGMLPFFAAVFAAQPGP